MKVAVAKESQSSGTDKGQQALLSSLDMSTDKPKKNEENFRIHGPTEKLFSVVGGKKLKKPD